MEIKTLNIYEKLDLARKSIRDGQIKKDGRNDYSKYDYFTPEAVESLVTKACNEQKLICLTSLKADAYGIYQTLDLINLEDTKEGIHFELRTAEADMTATNRAQKMGGTDTYSERYIKMKVFTIKDNSLDFDSQDNRPDVNTFPKKQTPYQKKAEQRRDPKFQAIKQDTDMDFGQEPIIEM